MGGGKSGARDSGDREHDANDTPHDPLLGRSQACTRELRELGKRRRREGTAMTLAQCRLRGNQVAARLAILVARKPAAADAFSHMYAPVLVLP